MARMVFFWFLLSLLSGGIHAQETTPEPTPFVFIVWLPDDLFTLDNPVALKLFTEKAELFATTENIQIQIRTKKVNDVGGIMSTMRSANIVAPAAMPSVTLLQRQDLINAQEEGFAQPLNEWIPTSIIDTIGNNRFLGIIEDTLYGVPYAIDVQHLIYRPQENTNYDGWTFDDFLNRQQDMFLPMGRNNTISSAVLLQYLASGGTIAPDGTLEVNEDALYDVLNFYKKAVSDQLIPASTVNYIRPEDYQMAFIRGEVNQGLFSSQSYLTMRQNELDLRPAPIFTVDGRYSTVLNGWNWVIINTQDDQKGISARFIAFMMRSDNAREILGTLAVLPSQTALLADIVDNSTDTDFYQLLLENAIIPPDDKLSLIFERAFQDALISIIADNATVQDAVTAVLASAEQ